MAGKFTLDLTRIVEKTKGKIDLVTQKATVDIFSSVIMKNPVGNPDLWKVVRPPKGYVGGRSRANWVCSIISPSRKTTDNVDPSGSETIAAMAGVAGNTKAGGVVYLCNSLPYVPRLEYGYSKQAPQGMVRITILEYQKYLRNAIGSVRSS